VIKLKLKENQNLKSLVERSEF